MAARRVRDDSIAAAAVAAVAAEDASAFDIIDACTDVRVCYRIGVHRFDRSQ